jgi:hypothetical protein
MAVVVGVSMLVRLSVVVCMAVLVRMRVSVGEWLRGLPVGEVPVSAPVRVAVDVVSMLVALAGCRGAHRKNGSPKAVRG